MVDILLSWNPSEVFTNMPSCLSGYLTSVSFLALLFLFLGFCLCSLTLRNLQGILGLENTFVFYNCATHHCSSCDHLSIPDLADAARVCMFLVGSPMPLSYHCPLPHQHHWPGAARIHPVLPFILVHLRPHMEVKTPRSVFTPGPIPKQLCMAFSWPHFPLSPLLKHFSVLVEAMVHSQNSIVSSASLNFPFSSCPNGNPGRCFPGRLLHWILGPGGKGGVLLASHCPPSENRSVWSMLASLLQSS